MRLCGGHPHGVRRGLRSGEGCECLTCPLARVWWRVQSRDPHEGLGEAYPLLTLSHIQYADSLVFTFLQNGNDFSNQHTVRPIV